MLFMIRISTACEYSACLCWNGELICSLYDEPIPHFSYLERISVDSIYLTAKQASWIRRDCLLFPRLKHVEMTDHSPCPADLCVPCS